MSQIENAPPEVRELLSSVCDRTATQEDLDRLEASLGHDADSLGLFLEYLQLHSDLYFELTSRQISSAALRDMGVSPMEETTADDQTKASPAPRLGLPVAATGAMGFLASGWPVAYLVATVIFAFGLIVGALVHVSRPTQVVQHVDAVPSTTSAVVGRITGMVDCVWEGTGFRVQGSGAANQKSEVINHKSAIHLGDTLALRSGLLEITYDTGAKVILQGPVTYNVESSAGGYLSVGKLTAKLEKQKLPSPARGGHHEVVGAGGEGGLSSSAGDNSSISNQKSEIISHTFAVRTPTAIVTDLGTEFGVEVTGEGNTVSHVFRGSVRVETIQNDPSEKGTSQTLHSGECVRIDMGHKHRIAQADPSKAADLFVRQLPNREDSTPFELVASWQFDGNAFLADSSGHGHTLINTGARQLDGKAQFDGKAILRTVDSIDLTHYAKIRVTWAAKTTPRSENQIVWELSPDYNYAPGAVIAYIENGEWVVSMKNDLPISGVGPAPYRREVFPLTEGTWETFAVEFDRMATKRSGIVRVFRDGKLIGQGTGDFGPAPGAFANAVFHIGGRDGIKNAFFGQIDNVKIEGQPPKSQVR